MSGKDILIVGASVRAAAQSACRAGVACHAADVFFDADLPETTSAERITPYPQGAMDVLHHCRPRAWMYTGAWENYPALTDAMQQIVPLWGNGASVMRQVRNPAVLGQAVRSAGFSFPHVVGLPSQINNATGPERVKKWLVKPYRSAAGHSIRFTTPTPLAATPTTNSQERGSPEKNGTAAGGVFSGEPAPAHVEPSIDRHVEPAYLLSRAEPPSTYFQQWIDGICGSAVYVASGDAVQLIGTTRQLTGCAWLCAKDFWYCGSIGPWHPSGTTSSDVLRLGQVLARRFRLAGLFGVDFIAQPERIWPIEINPRYTASVEVLERAYDVSTIRLHCQAWDGTFEQGRKPVSPGRVSRWGKAILYAPRPIEIRRRLDHLFAAWSVEDGWPAIGDVPRVAATIEKEHPITTVFARGSTNADVEQRLRSRSARIFEWLGS